MKITIVSRSGSCDPCTLTEIEAPVKSSELYSEEAGQPYKWVKIKLKSMEMILTEYKCWFDRYGNLCSEHGHLSPSYYPDLGNEIHVKEGCGFSLPETDWLKETL